MKLKKYFFIQLALGLFVGVVVPGASFADVIPDTSCEVALPCAREYWQNYYGDTSIPIMVEKGYRPYPVYDVNGISGLIIDWRWSGRPNDRYTLEVSIVRKSEGREITLGNASSAKSMGDALKELPDCVVK